MLAFSLKKFIGALLMPLPLITMLMITALVLHIKKHRKSSITLQFLALSCLVMVSTPPLSSYVIKQIETDYPPFTEAMMVDYIVVLGCGHHNSDNRSITSQLHSCSLFRTTEGVRIFRENPSATLIFSGYGGNEPKSNAQTNQELAMSLGVPASKIIIEPRAKDTREEALLLTPILQDKRFALVTSASHMERALTFFRQQQLYPLPAPTGHLYQPIGSLPARAYLPNVKSLQHSQVATYEFLGRIWQQITAD